MGFDKISVTLYDLLGYLLPGFIFLLVCSVVEASWFGTSLFALARYKNNPIAASITAYFLGQAGHALATWMLANGKFRKLWLGGKEAYRLSKEVRQRVVTVVQETYGIATGGDDQSALSQSDIFLLANSYIVAAGGSAERDIMMAREGFFKTSAVAFVLLAGVLFSCLFTPIRIQSQPMVFVVLTKVKAIVSGLAVLTLTILFIRRYVFFNCVKNNNILLTFLALRQRDAKLALKP